MPVKFFWLQNGNITVGTLNENEYHFVVPRTLCNVEHTTPLLLFLSYLRHVNLPPHSTQFHYCTNPYVAGLVGLWRRETAPVATGRQRSRERSTCWQNSRLWNRFQVNPWSHFSENIRNMCICAAKRIYST